MTPENAGACAEAATAAIRKLDLEIKEAKQNVRTVRHSAVCAPPRVTVRLRWPFASPTVGPDEAVHW